MQIPVEPVLADAPRIMVDYLGCEPFAREAQPTLREANDRIFYIANNLGKTDAGNFQYGEVTYVINPSYADKMYVVPWDSGARPSSQPSAHLNTTHRLREAPRLQHGVSNCNLLCYFEGMFLTLGNFAAKGADASACFYVFVPNVRA